MCTGSQTDASLSRSSVAARRHLEAIDRHGGGVVRTCRKRVPRDAGNDHESTPLGSKCRRPCLVPGAIEFGTVVGIAPERVRVSAPHCRSAVMLASRPLPWSRTRRAAAVPTHRARRAARANNRFIERCMGGGGWNPVYHGPGGKRGGERFDRADGQRGGRRPSSVDTVTADTAETGQRHRLQMTVQPVARQVQSVRPTMSAQRRGVTGRIAVRTAGSTTHSRSRPCRLHHQ